MAKFEVTKGKAVKSYNKQTSEPIFYEVGEVVEAEKMPSLLVGKCREVISKEQTKTKAELAAEKKAAKEAEEAAAAEAKAKLEAEEAQAKFDAEAAANLPQE